MINITHKEKLRVVGYPNYVVANNRIYNRKTSRELRPKVINGIAYYNLNRKKVRKDRLKFERIKDVTCPF